MAGNEALIERLEEDAEYLDTYTGFVGNNLAIARRILEAAAEIERLSAGLREIANSAGGGIRASALAQNLLKEPK
jgi:hypothetical protein